MASGCRLRMGLSTSGQPMPFAQSSCIFCNTILWSQARDLSARTLDTGFESRLGHGSLYLVYVLCRYTPCDELINYPRSPTICRKFMKERGWGGTRNGGVTGLYSYIRRLALYVIKTVTRYQGTQLFGGKPRTRSWLLTNT